MNKFKLYFEFYGKYMSTEIEANTLEEAKQKVTQRINFIDKEKIKQHKSNPKNDDYWGLNDIKDFLGI